MMYIVTSLRRSNNEGPSPLSDAGAHARSTTHQHAFWSEPGREGGGGAQPRDGEAAEEKAVQKGRKTEGCSKDGAKKDYDGEIVMQMKELKVQSFTHLTTGERPEHLVSASRKTARGY